MGGALGEEHGQAFWPQHQGNQHGGLHQRRGLADEIGLSA
jgi:hypothetical protein